MSDYQAVDEERIRERAYRLWEEDGCPEQSGDLDWQRALDQLKSEEADYDEAVEESFPASVPPAHSGIA